MAKPRIILSPIADTPAAEREAERRARIDAHHAEEAAQGNL